MLRVLSDVKTTVSYPLRKRVSFFPVRYMLANPHEFVCMCTFWVHWSAYPPFHNAFIFFACPLFIVLRESWMSMKSWMIVDSYQFLRIILKGKQLQTFKDKWEAWVKLIGMWDSGLGLARRVPGRASGHCYRSQLFQDHWKKV